MPDFLTRLIDRTAGTAPIVPPRIPSLYARRGAVAGDAGLAGYTHESSIDSADIARMPATPGASEVQGVVREEPVQSHRGGRPIAADEPRHRPATSDRASHERGTAAEPASLLDSRTATVSASVPAHAAMPPSRENRLIPPANNSDAAAGTRPLIDESPTATSTDMPRSRSTRDFDTRSDMTAGGGVQIDNQVPVAGNESLIQPRAPQGAGLYDALFATNGARAGRDGGIPVMPLAARTERTAVDGDSLLMSAVAASSGRVAAGAQARTGEPRMQEQQPSPTVIRVSIGRIDVRAVAPPAPAAPAKPRPSSAPAVSLDDYLARRNGAGR